METLLTNYFIDDSPINIGVFDTNMHCIRCSKLWLKKYNLNISDVLRKSYYKVFPTTGDSVREMHQHCLKGNFSSLENDKMIFPDGTIHWLNWKISPWKKEDGTVGGLVIISEDITNVKKEEEFYKRAQKMTSIGYLEVDLVTNKVNCTNVAKDIYEVSKYFNLNLEEVINFYKKGTHRESSIVYISDAISIGTPWNAEQMIVTATGNEKWVKTIGEAIVVNKKVVKLAISFQDISESKRLEFKSKSILDKLRVVVNTTNIGIWNYDIIENKLSWEDSMYSLYGINKQEYTSPYKAWGSLIDIEDFDKVQKELENAIAGVKGYNTTFKINLPNGQTKHIRTVAEVQRDKEGNPLKIVGVNWCNTAHKETELQLFKSKESFFGAFENSVIGMALVGLKGNWLKLNTSLCNSLGYTTEELMKLSFQDITHPDDLEVELELFNQLLIGERDRYQLEKRYYHKNGGLINVIVSVAKVKTVDNKISHFISQIIDISSHKEVENKVKYMLKTTSEQNEILANFAHIVSHNLRSHSSNLSMLTGFLMNEDDEEEKMHLLNMLNYSLENLDKTIVTLSEIVQIRPNVLVKLKKVKVIDVLNDVRKSTSALLKGSNAVCNIDVSNAHYVNVVPKYLHSILQSLITNSVMYCATERAPIISIKTTAKNNQITLTITDNGLGIDLDKHKDKLFGIYKTFHNQKDSNGVSLFIAKNQIEAMNGKIDVISTVGVGTTFVLHFNNN